MPRVVLGVPMYRSEHLVVEALDSLLAQSYEDFAVVAIDDHSPDATYDVVKALATSDPRLTVEANDRRLGNCGNSNRVLARALELHPDCELFAWASDNDLREPTWLSAAVKALDEDSAAVLAYSRGGKVVEGVRMPPRPMSASQPAARGVDRMTATLRGDRDDAMIYGLQRVHTLLRVGAKPRVMAPGVLFLSHLALYGTFVRLPDGLWYRGTRRTGGSPRRQRAAVFGTPPPIWSWLPVQLQRAGWLTRELVIGNRRPPGVGRVGAVLLVGRFCLEDLRQEIAERLKRLKRHGKRTVNQLGKRRTQRVKALRRYRVRAAGAVRRRGRRMVELSLQRRRS